MKCKNDKKIKSTKYKLPQDSVTLADIFNNVDTNYDQLYANDI